MLIMMHIFPSLLLLELVYGQHIMEVPEMIMVIILVSIMQEILSYVEKQILMM